MILHLGSISLIPYRVDPFLIYHSPHVGVMNNQTDYEEILAFEGLIETNNAPQNVVWDSKMTTKFAHPSGRIPSHSAAVGWQPIHIPGMNKLEPIYSSTIRGLVRRIRMKRGEA